jgi:hypothetical protein
MEVMIQKSVCVFTFAFAGYFCESASGEQIKAVRSFSSRFTEHHTVIAESM